MWYEVWYNQYKGIWEIFKVTQNGQTYVMYKTYKTEKADKGWAAKQWYKVTWH